MTRPLKGFAHACKNLPRRVFIAFASVYRRRTIKAASDGSERDETWANQERLVTQLLTTPFLRLAILGPDGAGNATFIRGIIRNSRVQGYFAECCAIVSCDGALSADAVIDRLAVELGVLETVADPFAAVLGKLVTHKRTLIVFNQLDAIYSMIGPEQQKAIDFLLVTLAGVEKLSLVVTFSGTLLPECVAWTMVEYSGGTPSAPKAQAVPSQPANRPLMLAHSSVPPARPAVFHGRSKELERLVASATVPSTAPIGIVGPGGIGKTTLALKVLHDPRVKQHFGNECFFLTCEEASSPEEVLACLASKLGVQKCADTSLWPAVLESLRSRERVLLLIDNFESIWSPTDEEMREASEVLLAQLAVIDELTILVTTRGNLLPESFTWANVDTAELDTLSSTAARQTFNDLTCLKPLILDSELETNALTELLREVDFMPLAITLLARLDDLPSRLLREWSEHYTAVLEADHHDGTRRELSVEVSIKISLAHLPTESASLRPRQLLSVLGRLPAGLFPGVLAELRSTIPNLDLAAQYLFRHSLVYPGGYDELKVLSPVRHYVSASLPISDSTLSTLDEIYITIAHASPDADCSVSDEEAYDFELPNITSVLISTLDRRSDKELVWAILALSAY